MSDQEQSAKEVVEDICGDMGFRLVWKVDGDTSINVTAYEITGRDGETNAPSFDRLGAKSWPDDVEDVSEAEPYLTAFMKWDCCCHFNFGREGYLHLCGRESFVKHIALMAHLHKRAPELMRSGADEDWYGKPLSEGP